MLCKEFKRWVEKEGPVNAARLISEHCTGKNRNGNRKEVKYQYVQQWIRNDVPIPASSVLAVEAASGISRHLLNPEIFPKDSAA